MGNTKGETCTEKKKIKIGLIPKLIIAIILGILFGSFMPEWFNRAIVTCSSIFSTFLSFIIPLMIVAYVTMGIANLRSGAGKLLLITVILSYVSTLVAGSASYLVSSNLFPSFMSEGALDQIAQTADVSLESYFTLSITPLLDTLSAVTLAFVLGLCLSTMRGKEIGDSLYHGMEDFSAIIDKVLHKVIIPLLPLYICGTFTNMTASGKTFAILGILWKVFLVVIAMHLIYIVIQFVVASPGAPGGSIMTALPFLYMVFGAEAGDVNGPICAIMVALYITQDSFGTACNVSGDNAIGTIVNTIYQKFILKAPAASEE